MDFMDVVDAVDAVDAVGMGSLWDGVYGAWTVLCTPRQILNGLVVGVLWIARCYCRPLVVGQSRWQRTLNIWTLNKCSR
jgi:hypothetical protein